MPGSQGAALDVELAAVDRPQRCVEPQPALAVTGIFPGLERTQHLRGEGLMDLVVIEILQGQLVARQ
ncbi:hypothetical protein D3C80_1901220 [compost metagenome]